MTEDGGGRCVRKEEDHKGFPHRDAQRDSHCYVVHHAVEAGIKRDWRTQLTDQGLMDDLNAQRRHDLLGWWSQKTFLIPASRMRAGRMKAGNVWFLWRGAQIFQPSEIMDNSMPFYMHIRWDSPTAR